MILPKPNIRETGKMWAPMEDRYAIIDTMSWDINYVDLPPDNCYLHGQFLPNSSAVVCPGEEEIYLFDLLSREQENLHIPVVERVYWTPNGRFLYYRRENSTGNISVYRYDLRTKLETVLVEQMNNECRGCILSPDGEIYLGPHADSELFDYISKQAIEPYQALNPPISEHGLLLPINLLMRNRFRGAH